MCTGWALAESGAVAASSPWIRLLIEGGPLEERRRTVQAGEHEVGPGADWANAGGVLQRFWPKTVRAPAIAWSVMSISVLCGKMSFMG